MDEKQKDERIVNRESWLRVGVISVFTVIAAVLLLVLGWRVINASVSIDLAKVSFSELLSVMLAVFAIGLSIAFYFKATQTSNTFYDNTYKFTRDVSELLGRIEAGFGERLKHLDEGYSGLVDKFEKIPFDFIEARHEIEQEEEEVTRKEEERNKIIEDLAKKANLETEERQRIVGQLQEKDAELLEAKKELGILKSSMRAAETGVETDAASNILPRVIRYINRRVFANLNRQFISNGSFDEVSAQFDIEKHRFHRVFQGDLKKLGLMDENRKLTPSGFLVLQAVALRVEPASSVVEVKTEGI